MSRSKSETFGNKKRRLDVRSLEGGGIPLAIFDGSRCVLGVRNSVGEWVAVLRAKKFSDVRLSDESVGKIAAKMHGEPLLSAAEIRPCFNISAHADGER